MELLTREGRQRDCTFQILMAIAKNAEEVHYVPINVVVSFDGGGMTVEEDGCRTCERFAVVVAARQKRQKPI